MREREVSKKLIFLVIGIFLISFVSAGFFGNLFKNFESRISGEAISSGNPLSERTDLNIEIFVKTVKDEYVVGEKILLFGNPKGELFDKEILEEKILIEELDEDIIEGDGPNRLDMTARVIDSPEDEFFLKDVENLEERSYEGYIIEFEGKSVLAKKEELIEEVTGEKYDSSILGVKAVSENNLNKIQENLKEYSNILQAENSKIKNEIFSKAEISSKTEFKEYNLAFNGIFLDIDEGNISEIKKIPGVKAVYPNYEYKANLQESVSYVGAKEIWKYDSDFSLCSDSGKDCLTGKGVKIGILDTGVDYTHSAFGSCTRNQFLNGECEEVAGGWDFLRDSPDARDYGGHGTHCASIAAGKGEIRGVAPDAKIYSLVVLSPSGWGSGKHILQALEYSVDLNQNGIPLENQDDYLDVLSMSFGAKFGSSEDIITKTVNDLVSKGIVVVISAGNEGIGNERSILSPGVSSEAITVGASNKNRGVSSFSSIGPVHWNEGEVDNYILKPDVVAPGKDICAARYGTMMQNFCHDENYVYASGTSMAAPHVAGAVAILKQKNPDWSPYEIKAILKQTANKESNNLNEQGAGSINLFKAIKNYRNDYINLLPQIDNVTVDSKGVARIYGTAQGPSGYKYSVEIEAESGSGNLEVCEGGANKYRELLCTFEVPQRGRYNVELELSRFWPLKKEQSYGYFEYGEDIQLLNPSKELIVGGKEISVMGVFGGKNYKKHEIKYRKKGENSWSSEGIILDSYSSLSLDERRLGIIDISTLDEGIYDLRIDIIYEGNLESRIIRKDSFVIDSSLKKGWGKNIPGEGFVHPVVSDIDLDGFKEIIVFSHEKEKKLIVYDFEGNILWSKKINTNQKYPSIGNVNFDKFEEIVFYSDETQELFIYDKQGGFEKYYIEMPLGVELIIGDLDNDGVEEIILFSNQEKIKIFDSGKIISEIDVDEGLKLGPNSKPAIGNFDDDDELEFVVGYYEYSLFSKYFVYNLDGSILEGWPIEIEGQAYSSPVVADLNDDSFQEIILAIRNEGVLILNSSGTVISSNLDYENYFSSPSIGDFEGDGFLEIFVDENIEQKNFVVDFLGNIKREWNIFSYEQGSIWTKDNEFYFLSKGPRGFFIIDKKGNYLEGFPKFEGRYFFKPFVTDLENDGKIDLVIGSEGALYVWELGNYDLIQWPTEGHDSRNSGNFHFNNFEKEEVIPLKNFSKILNKNDFNLKGKLKMSLQKKYHGIWTTEQIVLDEDVMIPAKSSLYLANDLNYGWNNKNISASSSGEYRIYVSFESGRGESWKAWNFEVINESDCIDHDGKNPFVKSFVTKLVNYPEDSCNENNSVLEWICQENNPTTVIIPCGKGFVCKNGACILTNETNNVLTNETNKIERNYEKDSLDVRWSPWFNEDDSQGEGDFELIKNEKVSNFCKKIIAIECRSVDGRGYMETGEKVHLDFSIGCWCEHSEQNDLWCDEDYMIRVFCK